jgi:hypothetical protein
VLSGTVVPEQGVYSLTSHERLVIFDESTGRKLSNSIMYHNGNAEEGKQTLDSDTNSTSNMAWVGVGSRYNRRWYRRWEFPQRNLNNQPVG